MIYKPVQWLVWCFKIRITPQRFGFCYTFGTVCLWWFDIFEQVQRFFKYLVVKCAFKWVGGSKVSSVDLYHYNLILKRIPFDVASWLTILSTTYWSFIGDDCHVFSIVESFAPLSFKDLGVRSHLSAVYFVEDCIGFALSMRMLLGIPFSSLVLVWDDTSMTRYAPHDTEINMLYDCGFWRP